MKGRLLFWMSSLFRVLETPALFINFSTGDVLMKCQGLPFQYKSRASVMTESAWERLGSMTEISNSSVAHQHSDIHQNDFHTDLQSFQGCYHSCSSWRPQKKHKEPSQSPHSVHILKLFNRKPIRLYGAIEIM